MFLFSDGSLHSVHVAKTPFTKSARRQDAQKEELNGHSASLGSMLVGHS